MYDVQLPTLMTDGREHFFKKVLYINILYSLDVLILKNIFVLNIKLLFYLSCSKF